MKDTRMFHKLGFIDEGFIGIPDIIGMPIEEMQKEIVQQFTGLRDKNRKEIFEGDIVKIKMTRCEGTAVIVYDDCGFYCERIGKEGMGLIEDNESLGNFRFKDSNIKIIGNKFENPELLK